VHGLFSGGKKRELETKIEALKCELSNISRQKEESCATAEKTQKQLTGLVDELASAKAELAQEEENVAAEALIEWPDDAIISAAAAARESFTKVGNIVTYGHYWQKNNTSNDKEAIEWIVVKYDSKTGKALLLSHYGLDAHRFDASTYQGWHKSEIRAWLNSTFLNAAFTSEEQLRIATTTVKTRNNAEWVAFAKKEKWNYNSLESGADTQDKIFLLSLEEAMGYGGYGTLSDFYNNGTDKIKATPTAYAVAQGAYQSGSVKPNGTGYCWWWLRSPGCYSNYASGIDFDGSLNYYSVSLIYGSVRPAFWLNPDTTAIY